MQIKRRKLWCLLISMFLLVSGMYFENSEIDSSFLRAATNEITSHISTANSTITTIQSCTNQMLGIHSYIEITQLTIRFANQRRDIKLRLSLDYIYQSFFSLKEGNSYESLEKVSLFRDTQSNLITKFIQKSDGKKQI